VASPRIATLPFVHIYPDTTNRVPICALSVAGKAGMVCLRVSVCVCVCLCVCVCPMYVCLLLDLSVDDKAGLVCMRVCVCKCAYV
jgi:hypothetical protein